MKPPRKSNGRIRFDDLSSPAAVEWFRRAAEEFTREATTSKAKARKILIAEGIYTKSGKLSKNYS